MKTIYAAYSEACMGINIKENENIVLESKDPKCCKRYTRSKYKSSSGSSDEK